MKVDHQTTLTGPETLKKKPAKAYSCWDQST